VPQFGLDNYSARITVAAARRGRCQETKTMSHNPVPFILVFFVFVIASIFAFLRISGRQMRFE
jgi:hypothetical protein